MNYARVFKTFNKNDDYDLLVDRGTFQVSTTPKALAINKREEYTTWLVLFWQPKYLTPDETFAILNRTWKYLENPSEDITFSSTELDYIFNRINDVLIQSAIFSLANQEKRETLLDLVKKSEKKFIRGHLKELMRSEMLESHQAGCKVYQEVIDQIVQRVSRTIPDQSILMKMINSEIKESSKYLSADVDLFRCVHKLEVTHNGSVHYSGHEQKARGNSNLILSKLFLKELGDLLRESGENLVLDIDDIRGSGSLEEFVRNSETLRPKMSDVLKLLAQGIFSCFYTPSNDYQGIHMALVKAFKPDFDKLQDHKKDVFIGEHPIHQIDGGVKHTISVEGAEVIVTTVRTLVLNDTTRNGLRYLFDCVFITTLNFELEGRVKDFKLKFECTNVGEFETVES